jgi:hypothetical protein
MNRVSNPSIERTAQKLSFRMFTLVLVFGHRRKKVRILLSIVLVATLSGCALFSSPKEQPVIEDHVHNWFGVDKVGLLSTTAERREVIFKFPDNKFCAEPPPDVAEALASSLTLLAEGSATDKTTAQVSARLEAAKTLVHLPRNSYTPQAVKGFCIGPLEWLGHGIRISRRVY